MTDTPKGKFSNRESKLISDQLNFTFRPLETEIPEKFQREMLLPGFKFLFEMFCLDFHLSPNFTGNTAPSNSAFKSNCIRRLRIRTRPQSVSCPNGGAFSDIRWFFNQPNSTFRPLRLKLYPSCQVSGIDGLTFLSLSNMMRRLIHPALCSKVRPVIPFIDLEGNPMRAGYFGNHVDGSCFFGLALGFCHPCIHHQATPVLHQRISHTTKPCLLPFGISA